MGFFDKLKKAFSGSIKLDEDFFEAMEETLILGDLGVGVATDAVEQLRTAIKRSICRPRRRSGMRCAVF